MFSKIFADPDHKLKILGLLFVIFTTLFVTLSGSANAGQAGASKLGYSGQLQQSYIQKVHGFHCHRSGGHIHRFHCPGHRACYRKCLPFAKYRFNCKNVLKFCLKGKHKSRARCYAQYRKCIRRAKHFCKKSCSR